MHFSLEFFYYFSITERLFCYHIQLGSELIPFIITAISTYSCYSIFLPYASFLNKRFTLRPIIYGLLGAFFFAFTFILNRSMELSGGSWVWSASLRFVFTLPILALFLLYKGTLRHAWQHLRSNIKPYLLWSTVGFGIFYAPLCFGSAYGEGWLVAGTWQIVIITGSLVAPFFMTNKTVGGQTVRVRQQIPWRSLKWSLLILLGIALMQAEHASATNARQIILCMLPILIAAFAYPLGNRKMMEVCQSDVGTLQRVFNMTVASMPFWILLMLYGVWDTGLPSNAQITQSFLVALFAGVIGTLFFFAATNLVRHNLHKLAAIEATQSGEVVFALLGEILFLSAPLPLPLSLLGILLIIIGMILHSTRPTPSQLK